MSPTMRGVTNLKKTAVFRQFFCFFYREKFGCFFFFLWRPSLKFAKYKKNSYFCFVIVHFLCVNCEERGYMLDIQASFVTSLPLVRLNWMVAISLWKTEVTA